jgi:hypothetical protein
MDGLNVLIGCEKSQEVCKSFRQLGINSYSCDIKDCLGNHPEWHIKDDVLNHVYNDKWDLIIVHPPCDFLANSGNRWFYHPDDKHKPASWRRPHPLYPNRHKDRDKAVEFFMKFRSVKIRKPICIENPIPNNYLIEQAGMYHQIIHPWMFGDPESKSTCLWLYGLPKLTWSHENNLFAKKTTSDHIYQNIHKKSALDGKGSSKNRKELRSRTYPGIAKAMAEQWGTYIFNKKMVKLNGN